MVDNLPLMVWLHDATGQQEFVNQTYCEYFGVTREKMRDDHWRVLVHEDDPDVYGDEFAACVRERQPFHAQVRVRRTDGQWRWLESWGRPRFDASGGYLGHVGTSTDVTEQKAMEKFRRLNATLEQRVAERTSALAMLNDIATMTSKPADVEGAILYALQRVSEHNGWNCGHAWLPADDDPATLRSSYVWYDEAPDHFDRLREKFITLRLRRGEGLVGHVFATGQPEITTDIAAHLSVYKALRDEYAGVRTAAAFPIVTENAVVGVLEFFSEKSIESTKQLRGAMASVGTLLGRVFVRAQDKAALRKSEEYLRAILDAAPDAIISIDRRGTITRVNPAAEKIFGYGADEMLGQNVAMLMPLPYREEHDGYIDRDLEQRQPHIIGLGREVQGLDKSGRILPIELAVNEIGHMEPFIGIIRDISRRKELEKEVVDAASDEQRHFGQDIHDGVGQELTGLRYMAQTHAESLAQRSLPDAQIARRISQWLETVQAQLRAIIRELIPVEVDQHSLAAALRGLAERTAEIHDLDCELECSQPILVSDVALATHLYRIAQEAVRNAVRHAQATRIVIGLSEEEKTLRLQVVDDKVGTGASAKGNTGFGLRLMAHRASLIGARFDVRVEKSGGTWMTCTVLQWDRDGWRMPEK